MTVNDNGALCVVDPDVPVNVMEYVPAGVPVVVPPPEPDEPPLQEARVNALKIATLTKAT